MVAGDVALGVDEEIELRHGEGMPLVPQLLHLDLVQEDQQVMGGLHLGGRFYNRFSSHAERIKNRVMTYRRSFSLYTKSRFRNIESTFYIHNHHISHIKCETYMLIVL